MVEFDGVCNFDRAKNGLVPVKSGHLGEFCFSSIWMDARRRSWSFLEKLRSWPRAAAHEEAEIFRAPRLHAALQLESVRGHYLDAATTFLMRIRG